MNAVLGQNEIATAVKEKVETTSSLRLPNGLENIQFQFRNVFGHWIPIDDIRAVVKVVAKQNV